MAAIWCRADSNPDIIAPVTFCAFKIEMKKKMHEFLYWRQLDECCSFLLSCPFYSWLNLFTFQYTFWGQVSNGSYSNSTSNDGIPFFFLVQLFAFNIQSANLTTVVLTFHLLLLFQYGWKGAFLSDEINWVLCAHVCHLITQNRAIIEISDNRIPKRCLSWGVGRLLQRNKIYFVT